MDYYVNRGCAWWVWVTHAFSSFSVFVGIVSEMDTKLLVELYSHPFYCAAFIFSLFFHFMMHYGMRALSFTVVFYILGHAKWLEGTRSG